MQACLPHHRHLKTDQQARGRPRAQSGRRQAARELTRASQYIPHSGRLQGRCNSPTTSAHRDAKRVRSSGNGAADMGGPTSSSPQSASGHEMRLGQCNPYGARAGAVAWCQGGCKLVACRQAVAGGSSMIGDVASWAALAQRRRQAPLLLRVCCTARSGPEGLACCPALLTRARVNRIFAVQVGIERAASGGSRGSLRYRSAVLCFRSKTEPSCRRRL